MDFRLTEEQIQIQKSVKDFAESEIKPHVMEWDEAQTFPTGVVKKLGELGMLGAIFPEEYGGAGLSYIDYVNIIEELGRGAQFVVHRTYLPRWERRPEKEMAAQADHRRMDRRVGTHRARIGKRRR